MCSLQNWEALSEALTLDLLFKYPVALLYQTTASRCATFFFEDLRDFPSSAVRGGCILAQREDAYIIRSLSFTVHWIGLSSHWHGLKWSGYNRFRAVYIQARLSGARNNDRKFRRRALCSEEEEENGKKKRRNKTLSKTSSV